MGKEKKIINGFQVADTNLDFKVDSIVDIYVRDIDEEEVKVTIDAHTLVHASLNDEGVAIEVSETCVLFVSTEEAIWLLKEANEQAYDGLETVPTVFTKNDYQTLFDLLRFSLVMTYAAYECAIDKDDWWNEMNSLNKLIDKLVYIAGVHEPDQMYSKYWEARQAYIDVILDEHEC